MRNIRELQEANDDARARLVHLSAQVEDLALQPQAVQVSHTLCDLARRLQCISLDLGRAPRAVER
jgi:hypothetical protein